MKILIINTQNLGDVVCGMIVINSLRRAYGEVSVLLRDESRELLVGQEGINVITINDVLNNNWDLLIDLPSTGGSRELCKKISAEKKIGRCKNIFKLISRIFVYHKLVPKFKYKNIVKDYYPIMDYFGLEYDKVPYLEIDKIDDTNNLTGILQYKRHNVAIHVGASTEHKRIPLTLLVALVQYFKVNDIGVILLGTEKDIANNVVNATDNYPMYISLSLVELKYVLSSVDLFIGSDSGVLHVAAAVGANCLALYGPTLFKTVAPQPLSSRFKYIEHPIGCNPCNQNKKCKYSLSCMNSITVDEVIAKVEGFLPIARSMSQRPVVKHVGLYKYLYRFTICTFTRIYLYFR